MSSSITIFGTGTLGTALGAVLATGGATIQRIGSHDIGTAVDGEIVILAVPYPAVATVVDQYGGQLAGKVVVDVTNPADFQTFISQLPQGVSSSAEQLQQALPQASVLKAFNTNFAPTLSAGTVNGQITKVLVVGDDEGAKQALIEVIEAAGLRGVDGGGLDRAHAQEQIGIHQIFLAVRGATSLGFTLTD